MDFTITIDKELLAFRQLSYHFPIISAWMSQQHSFQHKSPMEIATSESNKPQTKSIQQKNQTPTFLCFPRYPVMQHMLTFKAETNDL